MTDTLRSLLVALALTGPAPLALAAGPSEPVRAPTLSASTQARQVAAGGTTKPPGAALDARRGTSPTLAALDMRLDRLVRTAICTGC